MGKRFHAPSGATTIAGVGRRRTMRGMIDAKIARSADIRPVVYRRPKGVGGAMVSNPGSPEQYYVANPMGQTFKPGTVIPAGSYSGAQKDFLLTGPPAGPRGASLGGVVRRQGYRTGVAPPVDTPNFIGICWGDDVIAVYYINSSPMTLITSVPIADFPQPSGSPVALAGGQFVTTLTNPGATGGAIYSWDLETGTVRSHEIGAGYTADWTPAQSGDSIYWIEHEIDLRNDYPQFKMYFRLMKADLDLTNVSTVSTIESSITPGVSAGWIGPMLCALNSSAMVGAAMFRDQDGVGKFRFNFRIGLGGGATTSYSTIDNVDRETLVGRGVPDASGKSVLYSMAAAPGGTYSDPKMRSVSDDLAPTIADLWPVTAPFPSDAPDGAQNLHVYSDGATGLLYMNGVAYIAPIVGDPGGGPTGGAPSAPSEAYNPPGGFFPIE